MVPLTMIYLMKMWNAFVRIIVSGLPNQELQLSEMTTNVIAVERNGNGIIM